jgi:hypothetical protein
MLSSDLSVRSGEWIWHFKRSLVCRQGLTLLNQAQPALSDTVRKGGRSSGKSESCDTERISTQRRPAVLSVNCRLNRQTANQVMVREPSIHQPTAWPSFRKSDPAR